MCVYYRVLFNILLSFTNETVLSANDAVIQKECNIIKLWHVILIRFPFRDILAINIHQLLILRHTLRMLKELNENILKPLGL
jgi:hypothetical protein